jgi:hypothetical protein
MEQTGVQSVAVASDPTYGPLIAIVDSNGSAWAKEGSLTAGWTMEQTGVQSVAVASDPTNGPLIAILDTRGSIWAKEGSLTAGWVALKTP